MICPTFTRIHALLNSPSELHHHAALSSISCTAEFMNTFDTQLQATVATIPFFSPSSPLSPSPQVISAAIDCISVLASLFYPTIQKSHHQSIVPALLHHTSRTNTLAPRIRATAIGALSNFIELTPAEISIPYLEPMLGRLVTAIKEGPIIVVEAAITGEIGRRAKDGWSEATAKSA